MTAPIPEIDLDAVPDRWIVTLFQDVHDAIDDGEEAYICYALESIRNFSDAEDLNTAEHYALKLRDAITNFLDKYFVDLLGTEGAWAFGDDGFTDYLIYHQYPDLAKRVRDDIPGVGDEIARMRKFAKGRGSSVEEFRRDFLQHYIAKYS